MVFAFALVGAAQAHESWLLAKSPVSADGRLVLGLTSGMAFPKDDHAIKPDRVVNARWRQGEASGALKIGERGEHSLALSAQLPAAVSTSVSLQLPANALELDAANVAEYLEDLGEPAGVRERWQKRGQWRERYRKSIKAFVGANGGVAATTKVTGDDPRRPIGLPLELVPINDARTLNAGDKLDLRLLLDGNALPGVRVGLEAGGVAPRFAITDAAGVVSFRLLHAGPTLLHAIQLRAVEAVDLDWESDFTTLTLDVPHAPQR